MFRERGYTVGPINNMELAGVMVGVWQCNNFLKGQAVC